MRVQGSFLMGLTPEAREEYEARQLERLVAAQAQADGVAGRERKDSFSGESGSAGWLGRNMRKMRAKRERSFDDRDRTVDREASFDFSLSTSPGTERMMDLATDEGTGSGGSGRSRGFDGSKSVGHSSSGGGVSALGSAAFSVDASSSATPALWAVEEDSAEIRYMPAASPTEVPRVKAATADKLVEWLTTPKYSGKSSHTHHTHDTRHTHTHTHTHSRQSADGDKHYRRQVQGRVHAYVQVVHDSARAASQAAASIHRQIHAARSLP
jgi:hypothetical protein